MVRKKILIISDRIPVDSSMSGAPRIFELSNALSDEFSFYFILLTPEIKAIPKSSLNLFSKFEQIVFNPDKTSKWVKLFRWITPTASFDFRATNYSRLKIIKKQINAFIRDWEIDNLIADGLISTQFIPSKLKKHSVFEMCDCLSKLQLRSLSQKCTLREKISNLMELIGIWLWERGEIKKFVHTTIVSEDELKFFSKLHPFCPSPKVVRLGISQEYFKSRCKLPQNNNLIFFGSLEYQPNIDCCNRIIEDIFPELSKRNDKIKLTIVGSRPPLFLQNKIKKISGISLYADVDDIRTYVEDSAIFISPMRLGAGTKNKLLVSISMERPVISSSIGVEGIEQEIKKNIIIADSNDDFVNAVCSLLAKINSNNGYEVLLRKLEQERNILSDLYSWDKVSEPMREVLIHSPTFG